MIRGRYTDAWNTVRVRVSVRLCSHMRCRRIVRELIFYLYMRIVWHIIYYQKPKSLVMWVGET